LLHTDSQKKKAAFITGIAGFIGFHLALKLHDLGFTVVGCDDFNPYYSPLLKRKRAKILAQLGITAVECSLNQLRSHHHLFDSMQYEYFFHLAAQAGVRYSLISPFSYVTSNLEGFVEVLELLRQYPHIKCIYASSSSVYGLNKKIPFSEEDLVEEPANLYAATKKSNELMAHAYHHMFNLHLIGLRFFTVYGPWGRPDMAYFSFTQAIDQQKPIDVFNHGHMKRDFTYIDDIVDGILRAMQAPRRFGIYNLGNNTPEPLMYMIHYIEEHLGKKALINYKPMQPGDVLETFADLRKSQHELGYSPKTSLKDGLKTFVSWYQDNKDWLE
jgi:UDP-glucuronate 4-epimerase